MATLTRTGAVRRFPGATRPSRWPVLHSGHGNAGVPDLHPEVSPAPAGLVDEPAWLSSPWRGATSASAISIRCSRSTPPRRVAGSRSRRAVSQGSIAEPPPSCSTMPGIKPPTAIADQAENRRGGWPGQPGQRDALARIAPTSYEDAVATLRPADLLFIHSVAGRLSHVVLWIGEVRGNAVVHRLHGCGAAERRGQQHSDGRSGAAIRCRQLVRPALRLCPPTRKPWHRFGSRAGVRGRGRRLIGSRLRYTAK